ncbi:MAG: phage DNA encapsidation protein [Bacilli bacterium]
MVKEKWYNPNRLLSYNALMSIVLSPRGNGKSYSAKEKIIKNFLKDGSQSVYVRRTKVEIDEVKNTYWKDIKDKYPEHDFKVEGDIGFIDNKEVVYFIALSTSSNKKSASYPFVTLIVFDEYIITKTSYNRYLKNEVTLLLDLYETIARQRENVRLLIMGNAVSIVNPLFTFFDIVPNFNKRFQIYKDGLICLELFTSHTFMEDKKKSKFGKLIEGTKYGDYVVENKPLEDTEDFIVDWGNDRYAYLCSFKTEGYIIGVWNNLSSGGLICSERIDINRKYQFAVQITDLSEGYLYLKKVRYDYSCIESVMRANATGTLFYTSQEVKKIMQERVLPYL